jgi:EAL domain-containing protein (putative c-di-GMP-specific phosphodiesterase class I)
VAVAAAWPRRYFIVEDDLDAQALLAAALRSHGGEVISSDNARLTFPECWSPTDIFLIDLSLREDDGFAVVERLAHAHFPGHIVLMSAFPRNVIRAAEDIARAAQLRVLAALSKPFALETLMEAIGSTARFELSRASAQPAKSAGSLGNCIRNREVLFHYQPIVSALDGRLEAVEALARLREPSGLVRSAFEEIASASREDLLALSGLVVREGLHFGAFLQRQRPAIRVSVNIPSWQISNAHLETLLKGAGEAAALAKILTIELSEMDLFDDPTEARKLVARKVLKGWRFALDDFGVGASNADRIADLPLHELKVDRRFVSGCADDGFKRAVCRNAVAIARERGARVVAEGIERSEDAAWLRELGVDAFQGYLVARPMNQIALLAWLNRTTARV